MPLAALSEAGCLVRAPRATWVSTWMWSTAIESYLPRTQIGFVLVEDKVATPAGSPLHYWSHATILVTGDAGVLGPRVKIANACCDNCRNQSRLLGVEPG